MKLRENNMWQGPAAKLSGMGNEFFINHEGGLWIVANKLLR